MALTTVSGTMDAGPPVRSAGRADRLGVDERRAPRRVRSSNAAPDGGPESPGDASGDVLREAWRSGTAEPVAIRVRPELCARLLQSRHSRLRRFPAPGPESPRRPVPLVVDDRIPTMPGFEVHRAPPGAGTATQDLVEQRLGVPGTADATLLVLTPSGECRSLLHAWDGATAAAVLPVAGLVPDGGGASASRRAERGHR